LGKCERHGAGDTFFYACSDGSLYRVRQVEHAFRDYTLPDIGGFSGGDFDTGEYVPIEYEDHFNLLLFVKDDFNEYCSQLELQRPIAYHELLLYRSLLFCEKKMLAAMRGNDDNG
jgi:hypothetical protein